MIPNPPINPSALLLAMDGYQYPLEYRWLRLHGFRGLTPWFCIDSLDEATTLRKEFLREVANGSIPVRDVLPFARIKNGDDFAGFVQIDGKVTGKVCVVHLTFRGSAEVPGYPKHRICPSLWEWLNMVVIETQRWCEPRAVADLESSLRKAFAAG